MDGLFGGAGGDERSGARGVGSMVFLVAWPLASAAFMTFVALYGIPTFDLTTNIVGIGGIAIGLGGKAGGG